MKAFKSVRYLNISFGSKMSNSQNVQFTNSQNDQFSKCPISKISNSHNVKFANCPELLVTCLVWLHSILALIALCYFKPTNTARLHKVFQFLDGYRSEHNLAGFLHIGQEYSVFLIAPKPHDKYLQYELYESKNDLSDAYKPTLLAVAQIPVEYFKSQLKVFRKELHRAKNVDQNEVPGMQVMTVRDWQLKTAVDKGNEVLFKPIPVLRTLWQQ